MRLLFRNGASTQPQRRPVSAAIPKLPNSSVAAMYRAARVGGDFYDFFMPNESRLLFLMLDIAGKREHALHVAASAQEQFRGLAARLFVDPEVNESEALNQMAITLNRDIMETADGVRCAPAFLGCYQERLGTLTHINAGHTPAAVKDGDRVRLLSAVGPPLGLFSHATHDADVIILGPGAALAVVSKGLVESRSGSIEYGTARLSEFLLTRDFNSAQEVCAGVLGSVQQFVEQRRSLFRPSRAENDMTALALLRSAARTAAAALP
jgi:serine phosphatase RsbU (regulator of sigma subunit)